MAVSKNIIELHGDIFKVNCILCGYEGNMNMNVNMILPPKCHNCENVLKPGTVLFEETLTQGECTNPKGLASSCGLMFIVDTSWNVHPANTLPYCAKDNNAVLIEVNPKETLLSSLMDFILKGSAAYILPLIIY